MIDRHAQSLGCKFITGYKKEAAQHDGSCTQRLQNPHDAPLNSSSPWIKFVPGVNSERLLLIQPKVTNYWLLCSLAINLKVNIKLDQLTRLFLQNSSTFLSADLPRNHGHSVQNARPVRLSTLRHFQHPV
jgi:hypothetical protein